MLQLRMLFIVALFIPSAAFCAQDFAAGKFIYQGRVSAVAYDTSGNKYIVSEFQQTVDFNPAGGASDELTGVPTSSAVTKINADGTYGWTRNTVAGVLRGIIINGSTVYVAGHFSGTSVSVGGVGTVSGPSQDIFILALKASDGARMKMS